MQVDQLAADEEDPVAHLGLFTAAKLHQQDDEEDHLMLHEDHHHG